VNCAEIRPLLGAFVDDELQPSLRDAVEAHVARCEACAQALSRHRLLGDELRAHVPRAEAPRRCETGRGPPCAVRHARPRSPLPR
jgi:anti-sigma factor RsiW